MSKFELIKDLSSYIHLFCKKHQKKIKYWNPNINIALCESCVNEEVKNYFYIKNENIQNILLQKTIEYLKIQNYLFLED